MPKDRVDKILDVVAATAEVTGVSIEEVVNNPSIEHKDAIREELKAYEAD